MQTDFDIAIVGGGLVGASLACALRDSGLRIALVETGAVPLDPTPGYDDRTVALAYGSRRILGAMGVWDSIARHGASPIRRIHISERGRFGFTRLDAADADLPALGYVVANRTLGAALYQAVADRANVTLICPATVNAIEFTASCAQVQLTTNGTARQLRATLVVAADGADSPVRTTAGIDAPRVTYGQVAIVASVTPERAHQDTAYERFTEAGPLALLPAATDRCAMVWSIAAADAAAMLAWDDTTFSAQLQACFGERLGRFVRVGKRQAYPLVLTQVREHVRARLALIGNAAHTVHPVAGQGFNLGLRDVAALAQVLSDSNRAGRDLGEIALLEEYARWRVPDNRVVANFTHALIRLFSNDRLPLTLARNLGLLTVDLLPPVKRGFIRATSGLSGRLPRLACGLPLSSASHERA
jgi:2-octaprenyl-6-methoxyphenol hydroxylase